MALRKRVAVPHPMSQASKPHDPLYEVKHDSHGLDKGPANRLSQGLTQSLNLLAGALDIGGQAAQFLSSKNHAHR